MLPSLLEGVPLSEGPFTFLVYVYSDYKISWDGVAPPQHLSGTRSCPFFVYCIVFPSLPCALITALPLNPITPISSFLTTYHEIAIIYKPVYGGTPLSSLNLELGPSHSFLSVRVLVNPEPKAFSRHYHATGFAAPHPPMTPPTIPTA